MAGSDLLARYAAVLVILLDACYVQANSNGKQDHGNKIWRRSSVNKRECFRNVSCVPAGLKLVEKLCKELKLVYGIPTYWNFGQTSIALFQLVQALSAQMPPLIRIVVIGHAWGLAALVLKQLFDTAWIDVIDSIWNHFRAPVLFISRQRQELQAHDKAESWAAYQDLSPKNKTAMLGKSYQISLIDGKQAGIKRKQLLMLFHELYPHLADKAVVIFHDVMNVILRDVAFTILCSFPEIRFVYSHKTMLSYRTGQGDLGFFYRGFSDEAFHDFHDLQIPYQCGRPPPHPGPIFYTGLNRATTGNAVRLASDVLQLEETVLRWYYTVTGLSVSAGKHTQNWGMVLTNLETGGAMTRSDVELFLQLSNKLVPKHIFIIGNAWGYSTLVLSAIFGNASIDVIDAGVEGTGNLEGMQLTRSVADAMGKNVSVFHGYSPQDNLAAMRSSADLYEVVFIDALHTNEQIFVDFASIYPYLAVRAVVVLHDLAYFALQQGVLYILSQFTEMRFATYKSVDFHDLEFIGTGFMYRGFSDETFSDMTDFEVPLQFGSAASVSQSVVYMVPRLLPMIEWCQREWCHTFHSPHPLCPVEVFA